MPKYRLIVNPTSGRGTGERSIPEVKRLLTDHGLDFDMVLTERPWHAAELAREAVADGCEIVVAMGGDGVANEVLNGLVRAQQDGWAQAQWESSARVVAMTWPTAWAFPLN